MTWAKAKDALLIGLLSILIAICTSNFRTLTASVQTLIINDAKREEHTKAIETTIEEHKQSIKELNERVSKLERNDCPSPKSYKISSR